MAFYDSMDCDLSSLEKSPSLFHQCLHYIVDNWEDCLLEKKSYPEKIELKKNLSLPYKICDAIFELYLVKKIRLDPKFLKIFEDTENMKLSRIRISKDHAREPLRNIFPLFRHNLVELHYYSSILFNETELEQFLQLVNKNGKNLRAFSCNEEIFASVIPTNREDHYDFEDWDYILNAPDLEELTVSSFFQICTPVFFHKLITPLKKLNKLSIINGTRNQEFLFLTELPNLTSLTIHNINISDYGFVMIRKLQQLKYLDISVSGNYGFYDSPNLVLALLIENLPNLVSLDISGTNLDEDIKQSLQSRINNPLEFLGLYKTYYRSCRETGIPAKQIAGDSNVEQLLNAGYQFFEKTEMIRKVLTDLQHTDYLTQCDDVLKFLWKVVNRHPKLGTESQLVFVKVLQSGNQLPVKAKRHLLKVLKNAVLKNELRLDREFLSFWTAEELFFDVMLLGELMVGLADAAINREVSWPKYVFQKILEMADERQREELGINGGVIKGLIRKIQYAQKSAKNGWDLLWLLIGGNLANSKFFLQEGISLFEGVMEYLLDYPDKGLREMEQILIVFIDLAQFESIWSEYLKYEKNFVFLLIRALNFDYKKKSYVDYYAGCILLKFLTYNADESSIVQQKRDEILNDVRVCLEKFTPYHKPSNQYLEIKLFEAFISFSEIESIPECKYWAIIGIFWSHPSCGDKFFSMNREKGKKLLKDVIGDEFAPATVKKEASNMYQTYFEGRNNIV